jgi:hypothetical protein
MTDNKKSLIKSKKRVVDFAEVNTPENIVNAMLDMVKAEAERIESRFLEPACGDGNFLVEILRRKLKTVSDRYSHNPSDFERYAVLAVSSIYGIDILPDNVLACHSRLFDIFNSQYTVTCKGFDTKECRVAVRYILNRNIMCGDTLAMKTHHGEPIVFSEWSIISGDWIKRRDFRFDDLVRRKEKQRSIFTQNWTQETEAKAYIPLPIREFPPIPYKMVYKQG